MRAHGPAWRLFLLYTAFSAIAFACGSEPARESGRTDPFADVARDVSELGPTDAEHDDGRSDLDGDVEGDGRDARPQDGAVEVSTDVSVDPSDGGADATDGATDLCATIDCAECYRCVAGECIVDDALLELDAPICDTFCSTWANRCSAILATHTPMRDGACYDVGVQSRCQDTGGYWIADFCAHRGCGEEASEDCEVPCTFHCDCGDNARWRDGVGCVPDPGCFEATSCEAQAVCTDAYRRESGCRTPDGRVLDDACCEADCSGTAEWRIDPETGRCVEAVPGCTIPNVSPSCDPDDADADGRVCDAGLFLLAAREAAGVCLDREGRLSPRVVLRNYTERALSVTLTNRCPDGLPRFAGLPPDFDYYSTCTAGVCETTGDPVILPVPPEGSRGMGSISDGIRADGGDCNPPIPAGDYELTAEMAFTDTGGARICNFARLSVSVAD